MNIIDIADSLDLINKMLEITEILNDTLTVRSLINGEIKLVENTDIDYKFIIPTIIAVLSILFIVWDKVKWPKISGKVISRAYSEHGELTGTTLEGNRFEIEGIKYIFKFSINIIRKNLYYNDIKVFMKYDDGTEIEGDIYWPTNDRWQFDEEIRELTIPKEKYLYFNNVLEKDKTHLGYLSFFIDKEFSHYEEIRIEFIQPNGKKRILGPLKSSEIRPGLSLYEKENWKLIEN